MRKKNSLKINDDNLVCFQECKCVTNQFPNSDILHIFTVLFTPRCWLVKRSIVLTVRREFGGERHFQDCHQNLIKSLLDGQVQRSFTDRQELECDQN